LIDARPQSTLDCRSKRESFIERAGAARLEHELERRGIRLRRVGSELCGPCPVCGGRDRFAVHLKRQVWNCRGCCLGGDVIEFVRHVDGVGFSEALRILTGNNTVPGSFPFRNVIPPSSNALDNEYNSQRAIAIWNEAIGLEGTLAERYLRGTRRLHIATDLSFVLRFHPLCPFGPGARLPCLIALFRDIKSDEPRAIHRIALHPDATNAGRKMLGPSAGAAIKLTRDEAITYGLSIGEGIESTLAGMALGFSPAWALGSAGSIRTFPVLAGIDCLTIITDHDEEGKRAANSCRERWTDARREVSIVMSAVENEDLNDLIARRVA
jgi:hypothetical protein